MATGTHTTFNGQTSYNHNLSSEGNGNLQNSSMTDNQYLNYQIKVQDELHQHNIDTENHPSVRGDNELSFNH